MTDDVSVAEFGALWIDVFAVVDAIRGLVEYDFDYMVHAPAIRYFAGIVQKHGPDFRPNEG